MLLLCTLGSLSRLGRYCASKIVNVSPVIMEQCWWLLVIISQHWLVIKKVIAVLKATKSTLSLAVLLCVALCYCAVCVCFDLYFSVMSCAIIC